MGPPPQRPAGPPEFAREEVLRTLRARDIAPVAGFDGDANRDGVYPDWIRERAKTELLIQGTQLETAGKEERSRMSSHQVFNDRSRHTIATPGGRDDQRRQLAGAIAMRLDLPAADDLAR